MTDRVADLLRQAWVASLDEDAETWHKSPWAHIIFLIGQRIDDVDALLEMRAQR